ncbi:hypothetical protein GTC6_04942 [Gordonia terrae C-6]|uniref:Uncharacterized protein n=1 Tax=Gordonia terrae C-6 TaxID=1316928 RepID=R7YCD6_9ACTN|nr:hypothetical protein GTC6_04942 [Gordonia terrae C-6]
MMSRVSMPPIERRTVRHPIDRRTALRGGLLAGAAVVGAGAAGVGLTGCESSPSAETLLAETLVPLVRSANADESTARALVAVEPAYATALSVVADQRAQHARALREEIIRLDQDVAATLDRPVTSATASASAAGAPSAPPSLARLRADLDAAAGQARAVALSAGGYASGLTGSVAAAVTSMRQVQLA